MNNENLEITSGELAARLGVSHRHAVALLRSGKVAGRQLTSASWMTSPTAVELYRNSWRRGRGRTLRPESAWALLWMLAGRETPWLVPATAYRLRQELGLMTAPDIVRAVSGRTTIHRFEGVPAEHAQRGLVGTGESVAGRLPGLRSRRRRISGYADLDWIASRPPYVGLTPRYDGMHVIFEKNFPFDYGEDRMPDVVIAADLALCTAGDNHRREAALRAVAHFHRNWVASL